MAKLRSLSRVHPMVIFWLGLLTGAILVGLIFFYRALSPGDYQSSFYKNWNSASFDKPPVMGSYKLPSNNFRAGKDMIKGISPHGSAVNSVDAAMGISPHGKSL